MGMQMRVAKGRSSFPGGYATISDSVATRHPFVGATRMEAEPQLPADGRPPDNVEPPSAPRLLAAGEGAAWWGESWRIFCAAPGVWLGIFVVFVVLSIALVLIPIVGSLVGTVLTPVFAGGVMLGCHALAHGRPLTVGHLFEGFQRGRFGPLLTLGLLWLALMFVLAIVMVTVIFLALGASGLAALMNFGTSPIDYDVLISAGASIFVVGMVALVVALLFAMASWFAPALVVLNAEPPIAALQKSFAASWKNFAAFLLYGVIYLGLAIVATIPMGLGWFVLGPMLVGSCYAGWRTIFGR